MPLSLSLSASSRNGRTPPPRFVLARVYVSPFNPFRNPNRNTISEKRGGRMEAEKRGGILVAGLQTWSHELISVKGYLNTGRVARLINDVWGGLASGKLASLSSPPPPSPPGFAKGPWGTVEASLVYVTRDVEKVGITRRPQSNIFEISWRYRVIARNHARNFHPIHPPRLSHRFFLSVTYSTYFLLPFLVPPIAWKRIGEKNFERYFAPAIDAIARDTCNT